MHSLSIISAIAALLSTAACLPAEVQARSYNYGVSDGPQSWSNAVYNIQTNNIVDGRTNFAWASQQPNVQACIASCSSSWFCRQFNYRPDIQWCGLLSTVTPTFNVIGQGAPQITLMATKLCGPGNYTTPASVTFDVHCNDFLSTSSIVLGRTTAASAPDCMNFCGSNAQCKVAQWARTSGTCTTYTSGTLATVSPPADGTLGPYGDVYTRK